MIDTVGRVIVLGRAFIPKGGVELDSANGNPANDFGDCSNPSAAQSGAIHEGDSQTLDKLAASLLALPVDERAPLAGLLLGEQSGANA